MLGIAHVSVPTTFMYCVSCSLTYSYMALGYINPKYQPSKKCQVVHCGHQDFVSLVIQNFGQQTFLSLKHGDLVDRI